MTSSATKGRMSLARAALAIGIILGFASPAQAEKVTLSCEGEIYQRLPWNETYDIDYSALTVKFSNSALPAIITDREITFTSRELHDTYVVKIDRLAGTITANGNSSGPLFRGRCRAASSTKF